jgi:surface antigen
LILAGCLGVIVSPLSATPTSADTVGALVAQRQTLQRQVAGLGSARSRALAQILELQNSLNNLRAELTANGVRLDGLNRQQASLQESIQATQARVDVQRQRLQTLTRSQYKKLSSDTGLEMLFSSDNFGRLIASWMAWSKVSENISDTGKQLRRDEAGLHQMSVDLKGKQDAAQALQHQLQQENGLMLAQMVAYDTRVAAIDGQSQALLGQIAQVNRSIAAATVVVTVHASGGSSCGNRFDYGYCTWYVANRRCIPWFGNASEWYANGRSYGYPEGGSPQPGAVAVWGTSSQSSVGHVAYVESVQGDGFTVSEMNYNGGWNRVNNRFVPNSNRGPNFLGFIYGK